MTGERREVSDEVALGSAHGFKGAFGDEKTALFHLDNHCSTSPV